jgi:FkbM family methyltransferase
MVMNFRLLPRYLINFGVFSGLSAFFQVEWFRIRDVKVNGLDHRIELRPETTDAKVFQEVFLFQSYNLARPDPKVIVDGGGNIGLTSIFFAIKYPLARIYTVEPSDTNYEVLLKNVRPYSTIVPIHSALWDKDTSLKIKDKNENQWAYTVEECLADDPDAFSAISLSSLMKRYDIQYIDILKLDVEGAEHEIFAENVDYWIPRTRCILIELHDWIKSDCSKTVFKTLASYNFKTTIFNGMLLLINSDLE